MLRWLICWAPIVQRAGSQWQVHWTLIVMLAVLTSQEIMILKHVLKRTMIFCNFGIFAPKSLIHDVADPDVMVGDIQVLAGREGKGEILEALDPSRAVSARGWSSRYCFFFGTMHTTRHTMHMLLMSVQRKMCNFTHLEKSAHFCSCKVCDNIPVSHFFMSAFPLISTTLPTIYIESQERLYSFAVQSWIQSLNSGNS